VLPPILNVLYRPFSEAPPQVPWQEVEPLFA
jgi:hypothetical protein